MTADKFDTTYEPPTLTVVGTLADITKNSNQPNSDGFPGRDNAFPNPS